MEEGRRGGTSRKTETRARLGQHNHCHCHDLLLFTPPPPTPSFVPPPLPLALHLPGSAQFPTRAGEAALAKSEASSRLVTEGWREQTDGYRELACDVCHPRTPFSTHMHLRKRQQQTVRYLNGAFSSVSSSPASHGGVFLHILYLSPSVLLCVNLPASPPLPSSPSALPVNSQLVVLLTWIVIHLFFATCSSTLTFPTPAPSPT